MSHQQKSTAPTSGRSNLVALGVVLLILAGYAGYRNFFSGSNESEEPVLPQGAPVAQSIPQESSPAPDGEGVTTDDSEARLTADESGEDSSSAEQPQDNTNKRRPRRPRNTTPNQEETGEENTEEEKPPAQMF
ncbi:MAG: hypothetical protein HJJLKODD_02563 [Phycisphaerae bacterium]|nr:hypothetical protein [Phycisphaerae bacterium]